jgi:hypothetical protein
MMRDRDLFVVIGLLRAHLQHNQSGARYLLDSWFFGFDEMPSGALDLQLDQNLNEDSLRHSILTSADDAVSSVQSFGETVPSEWLTRLLDDGDGALWKDRPVMEIKELVDRFKSIIS